MNNIIFGITVVIICVIGYSYSWKLSKKENYSWALWIVIICGLVLRIYSATDLYLHDWDERYHALVAKNLFDHPFKPTLYNQPVLPYPYQDWTNNYVWLHKQPFPLWIMALSIQVFGANEIAIRIPSIFLTTIGIWITFRIGTYFFNQKVGFVAAFFYSINGLIIELTGGRVATDHIDIFFLFLIQLAIFFCILCIQKQKTIFNILAGITLGLAILTKWLPALVVVPVWLLLLIDSKKFKASAIAWQLLLLIGCCVMIFLPWQLYIFSHYPAEAKWESSYNFRHLFEVIEDRKEPVYFFFDQIRMAYNDLIYPGLIWLGWKLWKDRRNGKIWALFIWIMIPLIFFTLAKTKMQGYLLFISPALFIVMGAFWDHLKKIRLTGSLKWFYSVLMVLLLILPIRYTIERGKYFLKRDRDPQWAQDLRQLDQQKIHKGILFNYSRYVEAMFYTDLVVYPYIPERHVIKELQARGYQIFINRGDNIPTEIKSMQNVEVIDLHN